MWKENNLKTEIFGNNGLTVISDFSNLSLKLAKFPQAFAEEKSFSYEHYILDC